MTDDEKREILKEFDPFSQLEQANGNPDKDVKFKRMILIGQRQKKLIGTYPRRTKEMRSHFMTFKYSLSSFRLLVQILWLNIRNHSYVTSWRKDFYGRSAKK